MPQAGCRFPFRSIPRRRLFSLHRDPQHLVQQQAHAEVHAAPLLQRQRIDAQARFHRKSRPAEAPDEPVLESGIAVCQGDGSVTAGSAEPCRHLLRPRRLEAPVVPVDLFPLGMQGDDDIEGFAFRKGSHRSSLWLAERAFPRIIPRTWARHSAALTLLLPAGRKLVVQVDAADIRLPAAEVEAAAVPFQELASVRMAVRHALEHKLHSIRIDHRQQPYRRFRGETISRSFTCGQRLRVLHQNETCHPFIGVEGSVDLDVARPASEAQRLDRLAHDARAGRHSREARVAPLQRIQIGRQNGRSVQARPYNVVVLDIHGGSRPLWRYDHCMRELAHLTRLRCRRNRAACSSNDGAVEKFRHGLYGDDCRASPRSSMTVQARTAPCHEGKGPRSCHPFYPIFGICQTTGVSSICSPSHCWAIRLNILGSPLQKNWWIGSSGPCASLPDSCKIVLISRAVSLSELISLTPLPITSWIVSDRNG
ncbi:hypothetical protein BN871_FJ_00050 [Paenibacillus sp. P22]|nr:hypothetical protein BN871_FJ_00050 [Paenibacillus sp. P22]